MTDTRRWHEVLQIGVPALILFGAGAAAVKLTVETAPAYARGDFFDSPYLLPAFLGLAVLAVLAVGYLFFVVRDVPLFEILNLLPLLLPGVVAAFAGAALGSSRGN